MRGSFPSAWAGLERLSHRSNARSVIAYNVLRDALELSFEDADGQGAKGEQGLVDASGQVFISYGERSNEVGRHGYADLLPLPSLRLAYTVSLPPRPHSLLSLGFFPAPLIPGPALAIRAVQNHLTTCLLPV